MKCVDRKAIDLWWFTWTLITVNGRTSSFICWFARTSCYLRWFSDFCGFRIGSFLVWCTWRGLQVTRFTCWWTTTFRRCRCCRLRHCFCRFLRCCRREYQWWSRKWGDCSTHPRILSPGITLGLPLLMELSFNKLSIIKMRVYIHRV